MSELWIGILKPQPSQEELKEYYPEDYGPYRENGLFKYGILSRFLKKILIKSKNRNIDNRIYQNSVDRSTLNYLDFGCGGGEQLARTKMLHPNWNLYGLDNNEFACRNTKKKGFKIFHGDILQIDMPQNFFDIVNMSHVIEHLNEPKLTMLKINSIMNKNK